jgi:predicted transcriptional regulator
MVDIAGPRSSALRLAEYGFDPDEFEEELEDEVQPVDEVDPDDTSASPEEEQGEQAEPWLVRRRRIRRATKTSTDINPDGEAEVQRKRQFISVAADREPQPWDGKGWPSFRDVEGDELCWADQEFVIAYGRWLDNSPAEPSTLSDAEAIKVALAMRQWHRARKWFNDYRKAGRTHLSFRSPHSDHSLNEDERQNLMWVLENEPELAETVVQLAEDRIKKAKNAAKVNARLAEYLPIPKRLPASIKNCADVMTTAEVLRSGRGGNGCHRKRETMADDLGRTPSQIKKSLARLLKADVIEMIGTTRWGTTIWKAKLAFSRTTKHFGVPCWVACREELEPNDKVVYAVIEGLVGLAALLGVPADFSYAQITAHTPIKMSRTAVYDSMVNLQQNGLVKRDEKGVWKMVGTTSHRVHPWRREWIDSYWETF